MITEFIGFLIIVGVLLAVIIRRQQQKTKDESADLSGAAANLCQQVEAAGNQMIDRVETHVEHLEQLIERADEKIALLDQKIKQLEPLAAKGAAPIENAAATVQPAAEDFAALLTKAKLQAEPEAEREIREVGQFPQWNAPAGALPAQDPAEERPASSRNRKVFALMEEGCSEEEISRKTGIGKGALALIREMYKASNAR